MDRNVYFDIDFVALSNEDGRIECNYVYDLDETDDKVIFKTAIPAEELKRGWVGDLFCHLKGSKIINVEDGVTCSRSINNVLLSKITVSCAPNSAVCWTYTFLKD